MPGKKESKEFQEVIDKIKNLFNRWTNRLYLPQYRILVHFYEDQAHYIADGDAIDYRSVMRTEVDWPYAMAEVDVCLPLMAQLDDKELREAVVHELLHIKVAGWAKFESNEQEERFVTELARIICALEDKR